MAQALEITGAHKKVLSCMYFILLLLAGTQVLRAKKLPSNIKGSFNSQTNSVKIVWKCQIQDKKCRARSSYTPPWNTKVGLSVLV